MKKLLLALLFCFVAPLAAHATCFVPYTFSNGTIADATQVNANFNAAANCNTTGFANTLNPLAYGAKCDGTTDDTAALQSWAVAATTGSELVIPGTCVFKSTITFPLVNQVVIDGPGTLLYTGASTTNDAIVIGSTSANCSVFGWDVRRLRLLSNTVMTAGDALHLESMCESYFANQLIGGNLDGGNRNWWNGVELDRGDTVKFSTFNIQAQNVGYQVHGWSGGQFTDPILLNGLIYYSRVGLLICGGVGGFESDNTDINANGQNVLVDRSCSGTPNLQLLFGSNFVAGQPDAALFPSEPLVSFHVSDGGGPVTIIQYHGHIGSAGSSAFRLDDATPTSGIPEVAFEGATFNNGHSASASVGSMIDNQNLHYHITVSGGSWTAVQAGFPTIYNAPGAVPVSIGGLNTGYSNAFNITGAWVGCYFTTGAPGVYQNNICSGKTTIVDTQTNTRPGVLLDGSGNANGSNLELLGDGNTTPSKTLRTQGGTFQIMNDDYAGGVGSTLLTVTDAGAMTAASTVKGTGFIAGTGVGVSCSGSPTVSFASVNGIVTHC